MFLASAIAPRSGPSELTTRAAVPDMAQLPSFREWVNRMRRIVTDDERILWVLQGDTFRDNSENGVASDNHLWLGMSSLSHHAPFEHVNEQSLMFDMTLDVDSLIVVTRGIRLHPDESFTLILHGLRAVESKAYNLRVHSDSFPSFGDDTVIVQLGELPAANHKQQLVFIVIRGAQADENVRKLIYESVILEAVRDVKDPVTFARMPPNYESAKKRARGESARFISLSIVIGAHVARHFLQRVVDYLDQHFLSRWQILIDSIGFKGLVSTTLWGLTFVELKEKIANGSLQEVTRQLMVQFHAKTGFVSRWCVGFDGSVPGNHVYVDLAVTAIPSAGTSGSSGNTVLWSSNIMQSPLVTWIKNTPKGYAPRIIQQDWFANFPQVSGFRARMDRGSCSMLTSVSAGGAESVIRRGFPRNTCYVQAYHTSRYRSDTHALRPLAWISKHRSIIFEHAESLYGATKALAESIAAETETDTADHGVRCEFRMSLRERHVPLRMTTFFDFDDGRESVEANLWQIVLAWVSQLFSLRYVLVCSTQDLNDYLRITATCYNVLSRRAGRQLARMSDFSATGRFLEQISLARRPLHALMVAAYSLQTGLLRRHPMDETWHRQLVYDACGFKATVGCGWAGQVVWQRMVNFRLEVSGHDAEPHELKVLFQPMQECHALVMLTLQFRHENGDAREALKPPPQVASSRVRGHRVTQAYFGGAGKPSISFTDEASRPVERHSLLELLSMAEPTIEDFWKSFVRLFFIGMQSINFFPVGETDATFRMTEEGWRALALENNIFVVLKPSQFDAARSFCSTKIFSKQRNARGYADEWVWGPIATKMFDLPRLADRDDLGCKFKDMAARSRAQFPDPEQFFLALLGFLESSAQCLISCIPDTINLKTKHTTLLHLKHTSVEYDSQACNRIEIHLQRFQQVNHPIVVQGPQADPLDSLLQTRHWLNWDMSRQNPRSVLSQFETELLNHLMRTFDPNRQPTRADFSRLLIQKARDFAARANSAPYNAAVDVANLQFAHVQRRVLRAFPARAQARTRCDDDA
ncbi:hypothetical protein FVE85_2422 [Porphyridium purpureum]|uniref:Uncharacterized protein n=1 Tax=Porphyridium purpureum TaxID=35688 RepID=A0A5J4Z0R8_PORPP|nr:hypothetical protein FVE85_2422 [Porphyridium purpureum]|eukprot:POR2557..scf209_3